MKPPAPNPVSGLSTAKEASTAATAASTALPPSRSTSAPASAVSGWPAATTPVMGSAASRGGTRGRRCRARPPLATAPGDGRASLVRRIVGSAARRGGAGRPSKRVATTVTQIWSASSSSTLAPKMMLASGWAASPTTLAASETSTSERSAPPVIESRIERAPSIEVSSSGEEIAFSAARMARSFAVRHADPEQRPAGVGHDRPHVGEVEVDHRGQRDQVGDPLDALAQDVVGDLEGLDHRGLLVEHLEQAVVGDDDQGVDLGGQLLDALVGLVAAAVALEGERLGDDADGQRADLAGEAGDHRGGAAAGAAAGAGGDEDHVGALQQALDLVLLLEGGAVADLGVGAGAEAARLLVADVDGDVGDAELQRLKIGVDRHELDPGDAGVDHPVDRVDAGPADADDLDHRLVRLAAAGRLVGGLLAAVARGAADSPAARSRRGCGSSEKTRFRRSGSGLGLHGPARRLVDDGSGSARAAARRSRLLRRQAPRGAATPARPLPRPSSPRRGPRGRTAAPPGGSAGASSAVERKRSARGPSRMLARFYAEPFARTSFASSR